MANIFCAPPGGGPTDGINTALGCVDVRSTQNFLNWLLPYLIGILGGISLLLMIYGAFSIITSSGDPQKVKAGQETITSAVTGLIFTIFSFTILRLIAVDILHIPGIN